MKGSDRMVVMCFDGFHLIDCTVVPRSNGREVVEAITAMMNKWHVLPRHVAYDGNNMGSYIDGFIVGAKEFLNNAAAKNGEYYGNLKTQCADRFANRLNGILISPKDKLNYSIDRLVAYRNYGDMNLIEHICDERKVLRMKEDGTDGKRTLIKKSEMKQIIGHSPDFIETMLMLEYLYLSNETYQGHIIW
jgi:hypothetical protein